MKSYPRLEGKLPLSEKRRHVEAPSRAEAYILLFQEGERPGAIAEEIPVVRPELRARAMEPAPNVLEARLETKRLEHAAS